jgi:hypothetical protein
MYYVYSFMSRDFMENRLSQEDFLNCSEMLDELIARYYIEKDNKKIAASDL